MSSMLFAFPRNIIPAFSKNKINLNQCQSIHTFQVKLVAFFNQPVQFTEPYPCFLQGSFYKVFGFLFLNCCLKTTTPPPPLWAFLGLSVIPPTPTKTRGLEKVLYSAVE